mmetsp:Transcript_6048/g.11860  ORF Transcript_6048/g.11860 Transcript_6048/m.11860 type:complete len:278 (-) Transcript_6048:24-857(-)|eukprot:scaffold6933_cov178-Amphora_coffeaeformis.AAC.6
MKELDEIEKCAEELRKRVWGQDYRHLAFPVRLHMLLCSEEYSDDLWWVHGGRAFAVDRKGYKKNIMSIFFDQNKFRSLQTLLWKYGFCTIESINNMEKDVIIYRRKFFVKEDPELCKQIVRVEHASGLSPRHVVVGPSNKPVIAPLAKRGPLQMMNPTLVKPSEDQVQSRLNRVACLYGADFKTTSGFPVNLLINALEEKKASGYTTARVLVDSKPNTNQLLSQIANTCKETAQAAQATRKWKKQGEKRKDGAPLHYVEENMDETEFAALCDSLFDD